jgi:predicted deacylase
MARGEGLPPMLDRYASSTLLRSPMGRAVELYVFPGRSTRRALVIGGVHGTELVGVEVTRRLVAALRAERGRNERPFFTTIIVPALFPDNLPSSHGGHGRARRATRGYADPNRQFPMIGTGLDGSLGGRGGSADAPTDSRGRRIERANVALMELIRRFRPRRIASVHAIGRPSLAGVYSDPHRGAGTVLGDEAADLAQRMHAIASDLGALVTGSVPGSGAYPRQSEVSGQGVSLGEWGSRAVETGAHRRGAIPVITIELKREWSARQARRRCRNVEAFMLAIRRGFLEP